MSVNIYGLTKEEILKRAKWRCPLPGHSGHTGLEHPNCYLKYRQSEEKIGVLDIEAEDLKADYGFMFCYCLKKLNKDVFYEDAINIKDIKKYASKKRDIPPKEDTRILNSLIKYLLLFDRVVTHFGSIYDISFVRTRSLICRLNFPGYGSVFQTDTWRISKSKLCLSKNTLQNIHQKIYGFSRKDHLSLSIKHGCIRGEKWALDIAQEHCRKDVLDTEDILNDTHYFVRPTKTSI